MPSHLNPVHPDYFADPFVWQHDGTYYAIGTPPAPGVYSERPARVFPLLRSGDLFQWEPLGEALVRPDAALGDDFWAPEVAFHEGQFYLYYSVGHRDRDHQLRVAVSPCPEGPYEDCGRPLIDPADCPFGIDPHPFRDDDGQWYLFYARDFLDTDGGARPGTALVADRLRDMTRLDGAETVILRATRDWQRFLANRMMYGAVYDWHTLEGPFVRKHAGRYYCFYSGGRWETECYGVDYGVADAILGPYVSEGNEDGPRVLRTVPGAVIGPGHNSVVTGPDGATEWLVYHAWDTAHTARRLSIDRLLWTPDGPRCDGPTGAHREPLP